MRPLGQFTHDTAGGGLEQEGQNRMNQRCAAGQEQTRGEPRREREVTKIALADGFGMAGEKLGKASGHDGSPVVDEEE